MEKADVPGRSREGRGLGAAGSQEACPASLKRGPQASRGGAAGNRGGGRGTGWGGDPIWDWCCSWGAAVESSMKTLRRAGPPPLNTHEPFAFSCMCLFLVRRPETFPSLPDPFACQLFCWHFPAKSP